MQPNHILSIYDFSFGFESLDPPLLTNLSFHLYENETTLLIGPSGSGKSSLSLCLNGLYPDAVEGIASGDIHYREQSIYDFEKGMINQQIGIVFQDPESQFCMITVEDELAFTLENIQTPRELIEQQIDDILLKIGISNYKRSTIHSLSGGQKQKVALASVLLLNPDVLILDEPTANLDPMSQLEFIQLIEQIQQSMSLTILLIEHQADDWIKLVDRVMVLNHRGELMEDGSVDQIFRDKQSKLNEHGVFIPKHYLDKALYEPTKITSISQEPCFTMNSVSFSRRKQTILEQIDMTFNKGEIVAIVGENGAGKSTLLQLMARLSQPENGEITFLGRELDKWSEHELRQRLGFVFQNPEHQFITDTTYDEVAFSMVLNGYKTTTIEQRTTQLLGQFHLLQEKWQNPFALSGGQKRRLSVATMLDETPDLLLFDEPTFGQDAQTTKELMRTLTQIQQQGTAIVLVTHDMDLVDQFCESVYVLDNHTVQFHGKPEALWHEDDLLTRARLRKPFRLESLKQVGVAHGLDH